MKSEKVQKLEDFDKSILVQYICRKHPFDLDLAIQECERLERKC